MWTIQWIISFLCFSHVKLKVGPLSAVTTGGCEAVHETVDLHARGAGVFCHGVLLLGSYVLLPAHCVLAAKKLPRFHMRIKNKVLGQRSLNIHSLTVLVYPEFRLISYDKRDILNHDIALIVVRNKTRTRRRRDRNINIFSGSSRLDKRKILSLSESKYEISVDRECDPGGLPDTQLCLTRSANQSVPADRDAREYVDLDPRQGYYRNSCLHKSGRPLLSKCRVEALVVQSSCDESRIIAVDINIYRDWIKTAIITDTLKYKMYKRNRIIRGMFLKELRHSKSCPQVEGKNVLLFKKDKKSENSFDSVIVQQPPKFVSLPEELRVITDCGVEIRLETGVIHSPIHYKDVTTYKELLSLLQHDLRYRYRPALRCEWLITAPSQEQKVGLRFQYFDLHPHYDRLEVEEDSGDVARFRGGQQTRTIISGTDRLRLTFYSDHHEERRGFAVIFQPVKVSQCGGHYRADSGVIQSPNYPFYYPPNTVCVWKLQVVHIHYPSPL